MNKKYLLFFVTGFIVMISIFSLSELSYAQSQFSTNSLPFENGVFIYVQTIVKNSDGQIVTYLTSHKFTDVNSEALKILLDSESSKNDPIITVNGEKFQVIKRQTSVIEGRENVIASTLIAHAVDDKLNIVARFAHDGYPILQEEEVTTIWSFIRPID